MRHNKRNTYFLAGSLIALIALLATGFFCASSAQEREQTQRQNQSEQDGQGQADEASTQLKILSAEEIEALIENQANGQPKVMRTRVYYNGELVDSNQSPVEIERTQAVFDPASRSLVVKGTLNGEAVVEDIRFLEFNEKLYVLRDVYPDNAEVDFGLGRATPVRLDDDAENSVQADNLQAAQVSAAAVPTITSIGGTTSYDAGITNGRVDMSCGRNWNGYRVVNDQTDAYHWYVFGNNFGSTPGRVTLAGRAVPVVTNGWSSTRLEIAPTLPYNSGPLSTTLTITASTGTLNYGVSIVPAVRTHIYGQCTWHVAVTRLNMGKQPSPTAYGGYSSITQSYVPQRGDQLKWGPGNGTHTAIITAVSGPTQSSGGYKTWNLTVSEYNSRCTNAPNTYLTSFQSRTVNGSTTVTRYPQSSISGYGDSRTYYR